MTERSPLFQINLLLWLTWDLPAGIGINPILWRDGYRVRWIAPSLTVADEPHAAAVAAGIPVKRRPSPELLLEHRTNSRFLVLECKASSFGPDVPPERPGHPAVQAASLLCISGKCLAVQCCITEPSRWGTHLTYLVSGGAEEAMGITLRALSDRLTAASVAGPDCSAMGLYLRADGVYLRAENESTPPINALQAAGPVNVKVMHLEHGDEPRTLYLLPYDPSIGPADEYERRLVEERVRSAVASLLGSRIGAAPFTVEVSEVCQAGFEIWDAWGDAEAKRGFARAVRRYVSRVVSALGRHGLKVTFERGVYSFSEANATVVASVRRYLTSREFRTGDIELTSRQLEVDFGSIADEFSEL